MRAHSARSAVAFAGLCLTLATSASSQSLAVTGATVIDGSGRAPIPDAVVLIQAGRITAVGPARDVVVPAAAVRIDARGKYLIPGLMDANLHLYLNGDLETLIKYEDRYHEIVLEGAQIALKAGSDHGLRHLGPAGGPDQGPGPDRRGPGPRQPDLPRRQHHRLQRAARPRFPGCLGGA